MIALTLALKKKAMTFCLDATLIKPENGIDINNAVILFHGYGGDGNDISMDELNLRSTNNDSSIDRSKTSDITTNKGSPRKCKKSLVRSRSLSHT